MSFWKKKGSEIIDLTDMQKRGILRVHETKSSNYGETLDLTRNRDTGFSSSDSSESSSENNSNFDFLGGFAEASSNNSESVVDSLRVARNANADRSRTEVNEIKLKIDDTNYKLDNLINKVRELEEKLKSFESY